MKYLPILISMFLCTGLKSQVQEIETIPAEVDFSIRLRDWDGFGFNYVEAAQTRNYASSPQDYGGFSLLSENQKQEILEMIFGKDGLRVQIVKMFLDPYHQSGPGSSFDHEWTTRNMRYFVKKGLELTRNRGDELEIITTLYGPPDWATEQKFIGGRDLDETQINNFCNYMVNWVKYLNDKNYPVKYLSLHNEGEDLYRWDFTNGTQRLEKFDFNMYWSPDQINTFLKILPEILSDYKINNVKVTNGEPSNWTRFYYWGYAHSLYNDYEALKNLGLITTHGFINGDLRKMSYGVANSLTTDLLRQKKPELHAWVTSFSWGDMGVDFIRMVHENIYSAKVNAIIPWAGIQNPSQWTGGDPNPGCACIVNDDGAYKVQKGYYFYKQLTRAGYRGMAVAQTHLANPLAHIIAFAGNNSGHPDAFVITSDIHIWSLPIKIKLSGTKATTFRAFRTCEDGTEYFKEIGLFNIEDGTIVYDPPTGSTTTFIALD